MKKDIVFIVSFICLPNENGNDRFLEVASLLDKNEFDIEFIFPSFCHNKKEQRILEKYDLPYKFTMLDEPGYPTNICLQRFYSHNKFSRNVLKYLKHRKVPDIIYCSVPSLDSAYVASKYSKKNKVTNIIDVQDLWPEAFRMVFHVPLLDNIIYGPMQMIANKIYRHADVIVAVSDTYKKRAEYMNKKADALTVYLGTNFENVTKKLESIDPPYKKAKGEIWIGYLGTLGGSYDLKTVLYSMSNLGINLNAKLIIIGDGPNGDNLKRIANELNVSVKFLGRKDYFVAMSILNQCDIALNPLVKGSAQSIINKVGDYAFLGLPVINSLQNEEYKSLISEYNAGINIKSENVDEMTRAISELILDPVKRKHMGTQNRKLGEDKFNRCKTYLRIIDKF